MASVVEVLGYLTYPVTIGLFMSPIPTIRSMAAAGSSKGFDPLPYLVSFLQCSLWASYGLYTGAGSSVLGVNVAGAILQLFYVVCFYLWSDAAAKRRIGSSLVLILLFVSCFAGVIIALKPAQGATIIAAVAIVFNVGMFASPLSSVRVAVSTGDTSRVPIPLTVASCVCSCLWLIYGMLLGDWFIAGPNAAGLCLSLVQLIAVCTVIYSNRKQASDKGVMKRNTSTAAFLPPPETSDEKDLDADTGLELHDVSEKKAHAAIDWTAAGPSTPRILSAPSLPPMLPASTSGTAGALRGKASTASAATLATAAGIELSEAHSGDDADVGMDMDVV